MGGWRVMVRVARTREEALRRATERQEKRTRPSRRDARARDPARDQDDAGEEDVADQQVLLSPAKTLNMAPCDICGRKFNADRLEKHRQICQKQSTRPWGP